MKTENILLLIILVLCLVIIVLNIDIVQCTSGQWYVAHIDIVMIDGDLWYHVPSNHIGSDHGELFVNVNYCHN